MLAFIKRKKKRNLSAEIMLPPSLRRAKALAGYLDCMFRVPILRKKIGLENLLGWIPGAGDVITTLLALYILWVAIELDLPTIILLRMLFNIAADALMGLIPFMGKIADIWWKPNLQNMRLLEKAYLRKVNNNPAMAVMTVPALSS